MPPVPPPPRFLRLSTSLCLKGLSVQLRTSVVAYSSMHAMEKHLGYQKTYLATFLAFLP